MADNLTISIGADTSKMRADLALLQAQLKEVGKDLATAAKAGDVTSVNQLAASYENVRKQSVALSSALKVQTTHTTNANESLKEFVHSSRGLGRVFSEFSTLTRGVESLSGMLGTLTGGFTGGLFGVAVTRGFAELLTALDEVDKKLTAIRDTARQTNLAPLAVQASQEIAKSVGESADAADKMNAGVSALFEKARTASTFGPGLGPQVMRGGQATGPGAGGVQVFRGDIEDAGNAAAKAGEKVKSLGSEVRGGITIFRGGAPLLMNFADALELIHVKAKDFSGDQQGVLQFQKAVREGFLAMQKTLDPTQLNALSKALFQGLPADAALIIAPKQIAELTAKMEELAKSSIGATKERLEAIKQLRISQNETDTQFEKMMGTFDDTIRPMRIKWNDFLKFLFTDTPERPTAAEDWLGLQKMAADAMKGIQDVMVKGWDDVWTAVMNVLPDFQPWIDKTLAAFQAMWDRIKSAAAAVRDTLSSSFPGDPSIPAMPMAGGGMIRGPGTGTSDSILARLSNGEFVMRASAVRAWGADFMAGLNAFSDGGLVRPIPRFAGGGMVTATTSDGVTVNLHFPGGSFALQGDKAIVGGLTREARRAGMLSAGRLAGALT